MSDWDKRALDRLGDAEEAQVNASDHKPTTIWVVRHGDDLYVRSVRGREGHWYRGVEKTPLGRIRAGNVQQDVTFEKAGDHLQDEIDAAYRAKYRRYAGRILNSVLTPEARSSTLKLVPRAKPSRPLT